MTTPETKAAVCEVCLLERTRWRPNPTIICEMIPREAQGKCFMGVRCLSRGYERERVARVKAEQGRVCAIEQHRDRIRDGTAENVRFKAEIDALRAECATLRAALNWCIGHFQGAHPNEPVPAHLLAAEKVRKP